MNPRRTPRLLRTLPTLHRRWLAVTLACLVVAAPGPVLAQEEYVIGGGDVLQVNVWKNPELSQTVTVRPDGFITLPLIRDVTASGMTAMQLGKVVAERLSAFVNAANVTITVATANNYRVYTQGAIPTGMHALQGLTTARQLLSRAGAASPDADLSRAYLLRGQERIAVDLTPAARGAAAISNIDLHPGDVLVVPFRETTPGKVLVVGEVARPQSMAFQEGMTFLDAYLGAGGGTPAADLRSARIARQQTEGDPVEITVNMEELLKPGALGKNVQLRSGDIVIVPFRAAVERERILVVGEVRAPKILPFRDGITVLDAFVEAGGGTDFADLGSVRVVRKLADGKKEEVAVDLDRVMRKADLARNIPLSPGDIVMVPR